MYEGAVYVGGEIAALGNDAVDPGARAIAEPGGASRHARHHGLGAATSVPEDRRPGGKLWNFDKKDMEIWKAAL